MIDNNENLIDNYKQYARYMDIDFNTNSRVAKHYDANTTAYIKELYPIVEGKLSASGGKNKYMKCVSKFVEDRYANLYDTLPCARIYFGQEDIDLLFNSLGIDFNEVSEIIKHTYYGNETNFSPKSAKSEFTVTMMCIIKYFQSKKMNKELELALIHLSFSGMFYPSLHYRSYPVALPARHVMEYVVNNVLGNKFDLISEGSVIGAIRKIALTWVNTYKDRFKSFRDEDMVYCIQQLYSRIGSFMNNIAQKYYEVYEHQDELYIAYASDSSDPDDYHVADSDILKISKESEKTINYITTNGVNYAICKQCSDENITTKEINSIIDSILSVPDNIVLVKELVTLLITTYYATNPKNKDVRDISFITYSIQAKPNTKQPELLRLKEITQELLCENSPAYVRRRSREATRNSFERALVMYFALCIHNANR